MYHVAKRMRYHRVLQVGLASVLVYLAATIPSEHPSERIVGNKAAPAAAQHSGQTSSPEKSDGEILRTNGQKITYELIYSFQASPCTITYAGIEMNVRANLEGTAKIVEKWYRDKKNKEGTVSHVRLQCTSCENIVELFEGNKQERALQWRSAAEDVIRAGQQYWNHPQLKQPQHMFIVPQDRSELEQELSRFSDYQHAPIMRIKKNGIEVKCDANYSPLGGTSLYRIPYGIEGSNNVRYRMLKVSDDKIEVTALRYPIVWASSGDNHVNLLETPSVELLHLQMSPFTEDAIRRALNVSPQTATRQSLWQTGNVYSTCEEYFVHGLHRIFFADYVAHHPALGIDITTLPQMMGWAKEPVFTAERRIKEIGVQQAINRYIEDPCWTQSRRE